MRQPQPFAGLSHSLQQPLRTTGGGLIIFYSGVAYCFSLRRRAVREVLGKQIYFTGVEPLPEVLAISLLVGYLFVLLLEEVDLVAGEASTRLLIQTVVMELSPLICGMIVLSRSGTAMTSEIASMKQRGEIRSLFLMGIDPEGYLIAPRLFGVAIGTMLLSFLFTIGCAIGGLTVAVLLKKTSFERSFDVLVGNLNTIDLFYPLLKGAITGMGVAAIACYHGLRVSASATDIPKAVIATITQGTFFVLIANTLLMAVFH
jgi:phospholipid/cholesterol/gamma-HCH transport system permease protein